MSEFFSAFSAFEIYVHSVLLWTFFCAPFGIFVQDNNNRNFNFRRRIPTHLPLFMYEFTQNTMDISHEIPMKVEIKSVSSFNGNLFEFVLFFIFGQFQMRSILIRNVYFAIFFSFFRHSKKGMYVVWTHTHTPFTSMVVQFLTPIANDFSDMMKHAMKWKLCCRQW